LIEPVGKLVLVLGNFGGSVVVPEDVPLRRELMDELPSNELSERLECSTTPRAHHAVKVSDPDSMARVINRPANTPRSVFILILTLSCPTRVGTGYSVRNDLLYLLCSNPTHCAEFWAQ
jgi:hypothetical protein